MQQTETVVPQHVFVYGSLKKDFSNHRMLSDPTKALPCGTFFTKYSTYQMYSYGGFPGVVRKETGGYRIRGELYIVTPDILSSMDYLEGHPNWYKRKRVFLEDGTIAFMYLLERNSDVETLKTLPLTPMPYGTGFYQEWDKGNVIKFNTFNNL